MKRKNYILLSGLLLIVISFLFIIRLRNTVIPAIDSSNQQDIAFANFPEGKKVNISYGLQYDYAAKLNMRERIDQVRDWLLYSIISDANLSSEQMSQVSFDLPLTRDRYNENIASFDYTKTRSRNIGDGIVLALFPSASEAEEKEYLAHIADEQFKNIGEIPKSLIPFRYTIDTFNNTANIVRLPAIAGTDIYSEKYGYYTVKVKTVNDLENFLSNTRDLVSVTKLNDMLVLGGRQLKNGMVRNVTKEDIAVLYQSEEKIKEDKDAFEAKWSSKTYTTEDEKLELERERDNEYEKLHLVAGSGFSLDPSYRYDELAEIISIFKPYLSKYDEDDRLDEIYDSALNKNEGPFLEFLYQLKQNPLADARDISDEIFSYVKRAKFQKARYDGYLQGTEVGMHLFYTDLLAKLWTMDYVKSSPFNSIYGFVTAISSDDSLSRIYEQETDSFPSCRLWFGPNNDGFQTVGSGDRLLFARNATKIYAASSDPLQPGKEVPVSALFAGPIEWMNGHYEEIANYEQEYQVLNEIMKWSIVIGWLNANYNAGALDFLNTVQTKRNYNFPKWVYQHTELKYQNWSKINFFPSGYYNSETEALPILYSSYDNKGHSRFISGGVSLAKETTLRTTTSLSKDVNVLLRRSNLDYSLSGNEIKMLKGPSYEFNNLDNEYNIVSKAAEDTRLRSNYEELNNSNFKSSILNEADDVKIRFSQNETQIGDLQIEKQTNGFFVGFKSRDIDRIQSFARQLSDAPDANLFITTSDKTEAILTLTKDKDYLVKIHGSDKWARIELQDKPDVFLSSQWDSRVAGISSDSKICQIKFMDEKDAKILTGDKQINYKPDYAVNSIASSFQKGNYEEVIEEFSKSGNISKAKTIYKKKYFDELNKLDKISDKSQYDIEIMEMRSEYSYTPELKIRQAMRELEKGQSGNAEALINNAFEHGLSADADFYQELKQIIGKTNLDEENIQTLNNYFLLSNHNDISIAKIDFDNLPSGKEININEFGQKITKEKAKLFIQNNPGLNNIDWNVNIPVSINVNKLPVGARVQEMTKTSLADYRYEIKISEVPGKEGTYQFNLSAKPVAHYNNSNHTDSANNKPAYYIYIPEKATAKV